MKKILIACSLLLASSFANAGLIGFNLTMGTNGGIGITNNSDAGFSISSLVIDLTTNAQGNSFFDTTNVAPGTASTGWSFNGAGITATLPTNASTDGQQLATILFNGFDGGLSGNLGFDLDTFTNPDGTGGNITGTTYTVLFSSGDTLTATLANGAASARGNTSVPEPASLALLASGLFFMRRKLRK